MPTILLPYLTLPPFIRQDVEILRAEYDVRAMSCATGAGLLRTLAAVPRADLVLCWFGSLRYLPLVAAARLFRKPICIITGGYDVAALPQIGYGTMTRPLPRALGRWLFRQADRVAAFSESAGREARENALVPASRLRVITLGYDPVERNELPRERMVLTVANIDESTLRRKGLLTIAALSRRAPDLRFVLAGGGTPPAIDALRSAAGPNLELPGRVDDATLAALYARAGVYFQPSVHEGFGSAVAEAMLHDCVPVVSDTFSLPEVVGPCGLYAAPDDLAGFEDALRRVLGGRFVPPEAPSARILREFPAQRRKRELLSLVRELVPRTAPRA